MGRTCIGSLENSTELVKAQRSNFYSRITQKKFQYTIHHVSAFSSVHLLVLDFFYNCLTTHLTIISQAIILSSDNLSYTTFNTCLHAKSHITHFYTE